VLRQHDAHEFFLDLLSSIHEDLLAKMTAFLKLKYPNQLQSPVNATETPFSLPSPNIASPEHQQSNDVSMVSENNTTSETIEHDGHDNNKELAALLDKHLNLIPTQRCFYSEISNTLICMNCGYAREPIIESYTNYGLDLFDNQQDDDQHMQQQENDNPNVIAEESPFSSPFSIRKSASAAAAAATIALDRLLDSFFQDDLRELRCESCQASSEGMVKVKKSLQSMPQVLVIHLKRFKYDLSRNRTIKVHHPISFPKIISLDKYAAADARMMELPPLTSIPSLANDSTASKEEVSISPIPVDEDDQIIEDEQGWLCPQCFESNLQINAMCSHCPYKRSIKQTSRSQASSTFTSPSSIDRSAARASDELDVMSYHNTPAIFDFPANSYGLVAVIRHHGSSSTSGHYITDKMKPMTKTTATDTTSATKRTAAAMPRPRSQWQRCDDAIVTDISEEMVFEEQDTPYMLFYARQ
jgi:hypothetical protein